jgi:hypothetical protein
MEKIRESSVLDTRKLEISQTFRRTMKIKTIPKGEIRFCVSCKKKTLSYNFLIDRYSGFKQAGVG